MARNLDIPIPRQWPRQIKSAFLQSIVDIKSIIGLWRFYPTGLGETSGPRDREMPGS